MTESPVGAELAAYLVVLTQSPHWRGMVAGVAFGLGIARLDPEFALELEAAMLAEAGALLDESDEDMTELIEYMRGFMMDGRGAA